MKIHKKLAMFGVMIAGVVGSLKATGSLEFDTGTRSNMSASWNITVPAGATVYSLATATVGSISNPAWFYGGTLPGFYWDTWVTSAHGGVLTSHWTKPYNHSGQSPSNPSPSYASAIAGVAGPPAGLLHEARATIFYDINSFTYDEKWSYNLVGGNYTIYHGGGVSGDGVVTAYTEITW